MMRERLQLYIILGIAVIIAAISIFGAWQYKTGAWLAIKVDAYRLEPNEVGATYDIGEMIINLSHPQNFVKANFTLELSVTTDEKAKNERAALINEIKDREPQIKDVINLVAGSAECKKVNTARGKKELKKELVREINKKIGFMQLSKGEKVGKVRDIHFTGIVVECPATDAAETSPEPE